jgi:hypothetical protein
MVEYWNSGVVQQSIIPLFHHSTPYLHYSIFVRQITRQEQVDSICSAKLYALVVATSQLGILCVLGVLAR